METPDRVLDWPEAAYRHAISHCQACARCLRAGGEEADPKALCPTGRTLMAVWERAEAAWAKAEGGR